MVEKNLKVKQKEPIDLIVRPFQKFAQIEASGGILLVICALIALVWANSPWSEIYHKLWKVHVTFSFGAIHLSYELLHWINDGLMAIFFFVVGMEIKQELAEGELSTREHAMLPLAGALGGMLLPAAIYLLFNAGDEAARGWGIPMATDIAFALGVIILLKNRVPLSLRIFLTALAIIDDLGAVLVIAFFYTSQLSWTYLSGSALVTLVLIVTNRAGVRHSLVYMLIGLALWYLILKSGVHATIAGVVLAMAIPLRSRINVAQFLDRSHGILKRFQQSSEELHGTTRAGEQQSAVKALEETCDKVEAPLRRFMHTLHPWVTFVILPLFALANAGITLDQTLLSSLLHPLGLGIILGLVLGKQGGITLFCWFAVKSKIARLPEDVSWRQLYGVSWLGGIGFTMSLFIAALAFGESELLSSAKLAVFLASVLAGTLGSILLVRSTRIKETL